MSIEEVVKTNIMDLVITSEHSELDKPLISSEVGPGLIKDIEALGLKDSLEDIVLIVKLLTLDSKPWDVSQFKVNLLKHLNPSL